jgi:hypothetical protein
MARPIHVLIGGFVASVSMLTLLALVVSLEWALLWTVFVAGTLAGVVGATLVDRC